MSVKKYFSGSVTHPFEVKFDYIECGICLQSVDYYKENRWENLTIPFIQYDSTFSHSKNKNRSKQSEARKSAQR